MTIEVLISKDELQGLSDPSTYIQNRLRKAGIPVSGFFSFTSAISKGILRKDSVESGNIVKYTWVE